jgi:hypothetical protein
MEGGVEVFSDKGEQVLEDVVLFSRASGGTNHHWPKLFK